MNNAIKKITEVKKKKYNPIVYLLFIFIILTAVVMSKRDEVRPSLAINDKKIWIDIADVPEKRTRGLSGRLALAENEGMFFIFDAPGRFSFWMKDMNFPIDIIWIDENFKIADITKNALPESFPNIFQPRVPAQYVLEVIAGWADKNNIKIGDKVLFSR